MCSRNIVVPDLTIHSLFVYAEADLNQVMQREVIVCMETLDNQLDFSSLHLENIANSKDFNFTFIQKREVVQRDCICDDIVKIVHIIDINNKHYGIALRNSGAFDIYWNMSVVDSPNHV